MFKIIAWALMIEVFQLICVVLVGHLLWKLFLRDRLPKVWVDNMIMMGLVK